MTWSPPPHSSNKTVHNEQQKSDDETHHFRCFFCLQSKEHKQGRAVESWCLQSLSRAIQRDALCQHQLPYLARISWQQQRSTVFHSFWDLGNAKSCSACSVSAPQKATLSILQMWKFSLIKLNVKGGFNPVKYWLQICSFFWVKMRDAPPCWHN